MSLLLKKETFYDEDDAVRKYIRICVQKFEEVSRNTW